jgi:hypothetical protein
MTGLHARAAFGNVEIMAIAQCIVLAPSLGEEDAGKAVVAVRMRSARCALSDSGRMRNMPFKSAFKELVKSVDKSAILI